MTEIVVVPANADLGPPAPGVRVGFRRRGVARGLTSTFEAAGFRGVLETAARSAGRPRWLMRLDLAA